jgi:HK97 family phage major capsid protein
MDYLQKQMEARANAWEQAKALLDNAAAEGRDLSAEENEQYARMTADIDERAAVIARITADVEREARAVEAMRGIEGQVKTVEAAVVKDESDSIRKLARGDIRSLEIERRDITTGSTGSPVPTSFYDEIIMRARMVGPMLNPNIVTVLNTTSGEKIQIPNLNAYSVGTLTAEAAVFAESDPTLNAFVELSSYKYGTLFQVSRELIEDAGVPLQSFFAEQVGNAIGFVANTNLTVGDGSSKPKGIVAAAGSGVKGTASNFIFTADEVIDLLYSLDGAARMLPGFGFMANGASIAKIRQLKDGSGAYIFQPSLQLGTPDVLLGYPLIENPHMASAATAVKTLIAGHLPSYFVRQVGGIRLDRSDDYAFANDLVTFRATIRVDGNLPQTSHVKYFEAK